jgi:S-disulfanyl-L-cysteine oxidoreductase SoxD
VQQQMTVRAFRMSACGLMCLFVWSAAALSLNATGAQQRRNGRTDKPSRRSVWDAVYTQDQANRGGQIYKAHCEECHQADLHGLDCAPSLVGEAFARSWNGRSVGDFFEKVQTTMPSGAVGSLTGQEYADVVSYVLSANKFPGGRAELPADRAALTSIVVQSDAKH